MDLTDLFIGFLLLYFASDVITAIKRACRGEKF